MRRSPDGACRILSNEVWTEHEDHEAFGGIVPEIAARSHVERLDHTVAKAVAAAGMTIDEIDAVAATAGPGLVGGVMVGPHHRKSDQHYSQQASDPGEPP